MKQKIGLTSLFILFLMSSCQPTQETTPTRNELSKITPSEEPWAYVVLGDSTTRGYPEKFAAKIKEQAGVTIEIKKWSQGGDHSSKLLKRLQKNEQLRQDIREAEIITFVIPWNVFEKPARTYTSNKPEKCGGNDNQDCLREALAVYQADTEAIVAEIAALRSPENTLILAHDVWQFMVTMTRESGDFEVLNQYWQRANNHVHSVCGQYGIPVARVYEAFMGSDHSKNPEENGLIYDGYHTTEEGQDIIVDLMMDFVVP